MKNKFYTLALFFGFVSPFSYSMDCPPPITTSDQIENNNIIEEPVSFVDTNFESFQLQQKFIKSLHPNITYIDKIDGHDPYIYRELNKFNKNKTIVGTFTDYEGRVYKNLLINSIFCRFEHVGFGLNLNSEFSKNKREMLNSLTDIHRKELDISKKRLNDKEALKEKTMLIHFIEDMIVIPIYGTNNIFSEYFQGQYMRLINILEFLYYKKDSLGYDEYKWAIRDAWKHYQKYSNCQLLKKILSKNSEKIKFQFRISQFWIK